MATTSIVCTGKSTWIRMANRMLRMISHGIIYKRKFTSCSHKVWRMMHNPICYASFTNAYMAWNSIRACSDRVEQYLISIGLCISNRKFQMYVKIIDKGIVYNPLCWWLDCHTRLPSRHMWSLKFLLKRKIDTTIAYPHSQGLTLTIRTA